MQNPICWTELGEDKLVGPDLIKRTKEKVKLIKSNLKVAFDRQNSYSDLKRKDIEYEVDEKVFLKVSPRKKVLRFGKKEKLSLRFIGLYEVIERVEPVIHLSSIVRSAIPVTSVVRTARMSRTTLKYE